MNRFTISLVSLFLMQVLNAQDLSQLYYAQPKGIGNDPLILPVYGDQGMLLFQLGEKQIYALRKGNIFTDTLVFVDKRSEQLLSLFWTADETISVNSYYKGCTYQVEEGFFLKGECLNFDRRFKKELKAKFQLNSQISRINFIGQEELLIWTENEILYRNGKNSQVATRDTLDLISSFQRNRIFGNNLITITVDKIFLWDQFRNRLFVISRKTAEVKMLRPLEILSESGVNNFYYDKATEKKYLWRWNPEKLSGDLHTWKIENNEFAKQADSIPGVIHGIYQDKFYVTREFDDTIGHFFIDPNGLSQKVNLLEQIEIKNR